MSIQKATFAGGCFWCMEHPFAALPGVISVTSGYTGGKTEQPTYEKVCSGKSGHAEAIQVVYDEERVQYEQLLTIFWHNIDPTVVDRQFCDVGNQYRTAIFFHTPEQQRLAEVSKMALQNGGQVKQVVTEIVPAQTFYPAEEYHQQYYLKNPQRYGFYRTHSGRDERLDALWGTLDNKEKGHEYQ